MADFVIKNPPEYNDTMRMLKPTDPAHADTFNALFGQLINNDAFLAAQAKSESFTLTNVNGWKKALEFTGAGLALNFYLSTNNARTSVSGVLNANINSTHRISQTSSQRGINAHYVDKAAVQFAGDRTILYFHTTDNIESIKLVINGSYDQVFYQNADIDAMADGVYIYDFKDNVGIVADRAIADGNGNNITEAINTKVTKYISSAITIPGWVRMFKIPIIAAGVFSIRGARFNVPGGGMSFEIHFEFSTVSEGTNWNCVWSQLGNVHLPIHFRFCTDSEGLYIDYNMGENQFNPVIEINYILSTGLEQLEVIDQAAPSETYVVSDYTTTVDAGIVATRALYDMAGNNLEQVANACTGISTKIPAPEQTAKSILEYSFNPVNGEAFPYAVIKQTSANYGELEDKYGIVLFNDVGSAESPQNFITAKWGYRYMIYHSFFLVEPLYAYVMQIDFIANSVIKAQSMARGAGTSVLKVNYSNDVTFLGSPTAYLTILADCAVNTHYKYCNVVGAFTFSDTLTTFENCGLSLVVPGLMQSLLDNFLHFNNCIGRIYCMDGIIDVSTGAPVA